MRKAGLAGTLLPILLLAAPAAYGQVNYGDFIGTGVDFLQVTEETQTAGDPEPIWEAPSLSGTGDGLLFFPSNFVSSCSLGGSDITTSILTTTIEAAAGNHFARYMRSVSSSICSSTEIWVRVPRESQR